MQPETTDINNGIIRNAVPGFGNVIPSNMNNISNLNDESK